MRLSADRGQLAFAHKNGAPLVSSGAPSMDSSLWDACPIPGGMSRSEGEAGADARVVADAEPHAEPAIVDLVVTMAGLGDLN